MSGGGGSGPHSSAVDGELDRLVEAGAVSGDGPIALTPGGREAAAGLAEGEARRVLYFVGEYKYMLSGTSPDEGLAFVCCLYPGMRGPYWYERLEPNLEDLVVSMRSKGGVTAERGAEMLGITLPEMWEKMTERGIPLPGAKDEDA